MRQFLARDMPSSVVQRMQRSLQSTLEQVLRVLDDSIVAVRRRAPPRSFAWV